MQFQKLYFNNKDGKRLAARLDLPLDEKPTAFALFAHCFTCTKNLNAVVNINRALALHGIAVLRFDFTGIGESEGDFAETNFSTNVADLVSAAQFLAQAYEPPRLLIGHSLGGAAVIQAAHKIDSVEAVSTIAAPAELGGLLSFMDSASLEKVENVGETLIDIEGKIFKIKRQFLDSLRQENMNEAIRNLRRPLLIFHSPVDRVVSIEQAAKIFTAARHPKSFISLDKADHLLSRREDSLYTGQVLAAWASKYLDISEKKAAPLEPGDNRVTAYTGKTGFRTEIIANGHRLVADEPIPVGGANSGPTPYDLLAAALGACTGMTLRMYADRKKLPLDAAVVRLTHRKIHVEDCQDCEDPKSRIDYIEREIELQGDLDRPTRQRMLEIADRCPVHRTLESRSRIVSKLKE
ncbi:MAG: bifunctional alpha/beta hydrolase/OsmC family protein [Deltaproteobacteria bacterium]|jgi:putative redox protein|nr:bifunctional alpha/beta hydrolase/OsmC family protein [Deltaproteobacteria bacterium]